LVQELSLEGNQITTEGSVLIARIIMRDRHLKRLSLANNPLGNVGVITIASALEQNSTLEHLDLSYCDIKDVGVNKLALSLKMNSTLQHLHLEGNHISSGGVKTLINCVYDTSSMETIWASNHSLRSFNGHRALHSHSFPETPVNKELMQQLHEVLSSCNRRFGTRGWLMSEDIFAKIGARKLLRHYMKGEAKSEYYACFEEMDEQLIPRLLGWLAMSYNANVIYGVMRDMPLLLERKSFKENAKANEYNSVNDRGGRVR